MPGRENFIRLINAEPEVRYLQFTVFKIINRERVETERVSEREGKMLHKFAMILFY